MLTVSAGAQSEDGAPSAAPKPPSAQDVAQLRASLDQTRSELEDCKQEIRTLRLQLQQVLAALPSAPHGNTETAAVSPVTPSEAPQAGTSAAAGAPPDDVQLLAAKVDQLDQTKVESASRYKVRLSGLMLMNAFSNMGQVDVQDLPNLAFGTRAGQASGSVGGTLRQSILGLDVTGPEVLGARSSAGIRFDFFGGFPDAHYGVNAGLVRLRTAYARLDWAHTSVIAGQDSPFFSPLSPTSYATLGEPPLSWSGNLWVWTPQIRVEHRWALSEGNTLSWEGGVLDPMTEDIPDNQFNRTLNPGEASRRPAAATHIHWAGNLAGRTFGAGVGGYYERQNYAFGRQVDAWAGTADWTAQFTSWLELSGEFYRGRALGGLGGGIWKSVLYDAAPGLATTHLVGLNDIGGWSQLKFTVTPKLEFNAVAGLANPFSRDLEHFVAPVGEYSPPLSRNHTAFLNSIYRPKSNLLMALEYRRIQTYTLRGARNAANQVNLAIGVSF